MQNYLLLLITGVALFVAGYSLRRLHIASSIYLAVLAFVISLWSLISLLFELHIFKIPDLAYVSASYLFSTIAASSLLTFSLVYSNRSNWIKRNFIILLIIMPLATQIIFWLEPARELFFGDNSKSIDYISLSSGTWSVVTSMYLYNFEIASVLLITDAYSKKPNTSKFRTGSLLAGAFAPLLIRIIDTFNQTTPIWNHQIIVGYSLVVIGLAIGLYQQQTVDPETLTCETVVRVMSDGWMVLDLNGNIVEANPAAEKIVGIPRNIMYGKSVRSILPDWPDISNIAGGEKELEMRRSVRTQGNWRYLNVRLSILRNWNRNPIGQLIVWRDITERKLVEDARQRARDEMFVLLNAISNAASHSISLEDFLSESVYQIIYPFQSQLVAIFLVEGDEEYKRRHFRMVAHFGLAPEDVRGSDDFFAFIDETINTKQPLVVNDPENFLPFPDFLKDSEISNFVILPLFTQGGEDSRILGALLLGRKDDISYSQDEVIRLNAITEQIANLIDSDRRRQLAIALSEREKLMRDLHDSVSQKLYGLVTLTEAAQAGLEAGSKVVPSQVLAKIGDSARHAVKEMRLFLYQMQPVDLEQGDLISALHHRLAAVEGRADIQAKFTPDEGIVISKEKEIALYYIAQEALNNILKHAGANSVLVKFRQTRKSVILEINDNGEGFDPKNVDQSGIGLQNIKSRTAQVGGKLKITSTPESGTKVKVTLPREKVQIKSRNRKNR
ncbi:MAG TPA: histidine kinase N-terminal 7TM domain-containing protein [Anaerolineales bacterium]|nr:histidine kinase N-terminal 7TM domain-containing protein [Anaerolineales bacterium]